METVSTIMLMYLLSSTTSGQDCDNFNSSWIDMCPLSQTRENWCFRSDYSNQKIEIHGKKAKIVCGFNEPNRNVIPCLPVQDIHVLTMVNCQFSHINFRDIVSSREPFTLVIEYTEDKLANLSMKFCDINRLRNIYIRNVRSGEEFPIIFGNNLTRISHFEMDGHSFRRFERPFGKLRNLRTLSIRSGPIEILKRDILYGLYRSLTILDFSWNAITRIERAAFEKLKKLETLYLTGNKIKELKVEVFAGLKSLKALSLDRNKLTSIRDSSFSTLRRLNLLNVSHTSPNTIPWEEPFGLGAKLNASKKDRKLGKLTIVTWKIDRRVTVDLSHNYVIDPVLPFCIQAELRMHLHSNAILSIIFNRMYSGPRHRWRQCLLGGKDFDCECLMKRHFHNAQSEQQAAVKAVPGTLHYRGLNGSVRGSIARRTIDDCPSHCYCYYVTVNCSSLQLKGPPYSIPRDRNIVILTRNNIMSLKSANRRYWNHVTVLNISYNLLESLDDWIAPEKLRVLDLRHNRLRTISVKLMNKVARNPHFEIYLSRNRWMCNCDMFYFKEWFMQYRPLIKDFNDVHCEVKRRNDSTESVLIKEIYVEEFCPELRVKSKVLIAVLPVLLVALLLYTFYYQYTVCAILYSCDALKCFFLTHSVEWKKYDAFVSASSADLPIVLEFVAQVEPYYRLCIPERDWPNDPKESRIARSTNVAYSLKNSRSTILVISKNSLQETWFQVEFRGAYNLRMEDDTHKMILIIVGSILGVPVKKDIEEVIASEPCLYWRETFFWQKLRYELRGANRMLEEEEDAD